MGEVRADVPALERFAARSAERRDEFDDLHGRIDGARVPRGAFGYIPGIGDRVHQAYQEFVDGCADAAATSTEMMAILADGMRITARAYQTSDQEAATRIKGAGPEGGR
jgi:hypothetical protein